MYRNTVFRSRLEARFAVLFDYFEWPWAYEPLDLFWYVPDFALLFEPGPIAVEIKPDLTLDRLKVHAQKMVSAGWYEDLLVLGSVMHGDTIGLHGEPIGGNETILGPAEVFRCINCGRISVLNADMSWRCRVSGCDGGRSHYGQLEHGELDSLWAAAGNRVQWNAPPPPARVR
jgi:hypothetical protein